jgi:hypothetical protein
MTRARRWLRTCEPALTSARVSDEPAAPPVGTTQGRRVLFVGFSERNKYFGDFFYATIHKLRNGFTRAGCHVSWFSDRDIADYAAPFRIRPLGAPVANYRLKQLVTKISPDIIIFMHANLITDQTVADIRRTHPAAKIVSIYLDPVASGLFGDRFRHAASISDLAFATSAGAVLKQHASAGRVGFIPNPVDMSVEACASYAAPAHDYDFFFAGKPKGRETVLLELQRLLPDCRYGYFFQTGKDMALGGAAYIQAMARSRIAINVTVEENAHWYSSDRLAQFFGAGCLAAQSGHCQIETLYGADAMLIYRDAADLAAQATVLLAGGGWRARAEAGQAAAVKVSDTTLVARYILDRCSGKPTFDWPKWTSEFYG